MALVKACRCKKRAEAHTIRRWQHILALVLIALAVLAMPGTVSARTAEDVSSRINQTGRVLPMSVPLRDSTRQLGEVLIRVEIDDTVRVSKQSLMQTLAGEFAAEMKTKLQVAPDYPTLQELQKLGLALSFDTEKIELVVGFTSDQRQTGNISFGNPPPLSSGTLTRPALFSGYINFGGQADYLWNRNATALRFDAAAVARLGKFVLETEVVVQNDINGQECPSYAFCNFGPNAGIRRQGSRLVYDWPESLNRLTIGDTRTLPATFQTAPQVLGFSFEHAPQKLAPGKTIRSMGSSSFTLERAATVEVLLNGAAVQHLRLPPGPYNLRDLPLRSGANDITLLITDDTGAQKTLQFTAYSSYNLLGEGKAEWAVTGGVPSYYDNNAMAYRDGQFVASAFWRYGLMASMTIEAQAQADNNIVMGGAGTLFASPFGLWGIQLAGSQSDAGTGAALRLTWELDGRQAWGALRLAFEIHSPEFRTPGQYIAPLTGIILPTFQYRESYSASYSKSFERHLEHVALGPIRCRGPELLRILAVRCSRRPLSRRPGHLTCALGYDDDQRYARLFERDLQPVLPRWHRRPSGGHQRDTLGGVTAVLAAQQQDHRDGIDGYAQPAQLRVRHLPGRVGHRELVDHRVGV